MNPPRFHPSPGAAPVINGQARHRLQHQLRPAPGHLATLAWIGGSPVHWVVIMPVLHFLVALAVGFLATELFGPPPGYHPSWGYALLLGPWLETLFLRLLPILAFRALGAPPALLLLAGWLPTAVIDFLLGSFHGLVLGTVGGFFLSMSCVAWLGRSVLVAYCVGAAHHLLVNALVLFVVVLTGTLPLV